MIFTLLYLKYIIHVILLNWKYVHNVFTTLLPNFQSLFKVSLLFFSSWHTHQPSRVGVSPLCDVVSSFLCHTQTEKISSWNGPTVHVCCFMLVSASTKTFVSRVRKTAKKIVSWKICQQGHLLAEVSLYTNILYKKVKRQKVSTLIRYKKLRKNNRLWAG